MDIYYIISDWFTNCKRFHELFQGVLGTGWCATSSKKLAKHLLAPGGQVHWADRAVYAACTGRGGQIWGQYLEMKYKLLTWFVRRHSMEKFLYSVLVFRSVAEWINTLSDVFSYC